MNVFWCSENEFFTATRGMEKTCELEKNRPSEEEERVKENNDVKVRKLCLHIPEGQDKFIPGQHILSCSLVFLWLFHPRANDYNNFILQ